MIRISGWKNCGQLTIKFLHDDWPKWFPYRRKKAKCYKIRVIFVLLLAIFKFWFHEIIVVTKEYYCRLVLCNFTCFNNTNNKFPEIAQQLGYFWKIFDPVLPQKQLVFRANRSYFFKACFLPIITEVLIITCGTTWSFSVCI